MENDYLQKTLIPDEPIETTMDTVEIAHIDAACLRGSRKPSPRFKDKIKREGVLQPIWIVTKGEIDRGGPWYTLLAGRRRLAAAIEAEFTHIKAILFPRGTTARQAALTLMENELRSENPLVELGAIEVLLEETVSMEDICEATGMDKRAVEARLSLRSLIPEIRDLLTNDKIAVGVATEAAKLSADQQRALFERCGTKRIRGKDVAEAKRARVAASGGSLPPHLFTMGAGYNPIQEGEEDHPEPSYVKSARQQFVTALGANPLTGGFTIDSKCAGELFHFLQPHYLAGGAEFPEPMAAMMVRLAEYLGMQTDFENE